MNTVLNYVLYFFAYSAIGWFIESVYVSIAHRKITNRGFLKGPMCPIYGTAALVLSVTLEPIANAGDVIWKHTVLKSLNPVVITSTFWLVILTGMIVADIVEFLTSVIMEKLFHARWWDYSDKKFNIQGRICLRHTMYWGLMSVIFTYVVHPFMKDYVFHFITDSRTVRNITLSVIFVIFIVDTVTSAIAAADVSKFIAKIYELSNTVYSLSDGLKSNIELKYEEFQQSVISQNHKIREQFAEIKTYFDRSDMSSKKERKKAKDAKRIFESTATISQIVNKRIDAVEKRIEELKNYKK